MDKIKLIEGEMLRHKQLSKWYATQEVNPIVSKHHAQVAEALETLLDTVRAEVIKHPFKLGEQRRNKCS